MTITARPSASQRTRNRLREHPDIITLRQGVPVAMGNRPSILAGCQDCGWEGWLPLNEVEVS